MKIEAVKLMRNLRNKMSKEIDDMSWEEVQIYLTKHIKTFEFLINKTPNQTFHQIPRT